jgi:hypothetical protein
MGFLLRSSSVAVRYILNLSMRKLKRSVLIFSWVCPCFFPEIAVSITLYYGIIGEKCCDGVIPKHKSPPTYALVPIIDDGDIWQDDSPPSSPLNIRPRC